MRSCRRYRPRGYNATKVYAIYCNGDYVGNSTGVSTQQALRNYCIASGIPILGSGSYGACGELTSTCAIGIYGVRPCGSVAKCRPMFAVATHLGWLTAN